MSDEHQSFGQFFRELRKSRRVTLRAFCERADADPGNISRMERSAVAPPQDHAILVRYASALDVSEGSDEWYTLVDLAAADRGVIPDDIMKDEALAEQLPAFFRTLRGQKPTADELRSVIDKVKRS